MNKEIEKMLEGFKSTFSAIKDIRTRQDFEKKLLVQYDDNATYMYSRNRKYLDEQLKVLVKAKNHGSISEEDSDILDEQAFSLLPEEIKKQFIDED